MDQASRQRRARKKLESLEQDNFHDDPHADLVIKKYILFTGSENEFHIPFYEFFNQWIGMSV